MKKLFIIGTLLLSATSFSANNTNPMAKGGMMQNCSCPMMKNPEMKKEMAKQQIQVEEKQLELHKALAEDKIDWNKVGKINRELSDIKADNETKMWKMHSEMMEKEQQAPKEEKQ